MRTRLKRIDIGSAFRVGFVVYAIMFAIFGLLFVLLQGWLFSLMSRSMTTNVPDGAAIFYGAGILGTVCFYGVGFGASAIGGGFQFAIGAWCYNLAANLLGSIKIVLEADDPTLTLDDLAAETYKRKLDEL